jgi:hypothetical protein
MERFCDAGCTASCAATDATIVTITTEMRVFMFILMQLLLRRSGVCSFCVLAVNPYSLQQNNLAK